MLLSRSRMSATLLHDILYLMGNRKIAELLIAEGALQFQELPRSQLAVPVVSTAVAALFDDVVSGGSVLLPAEDAVETGVANEKRNNRESPAQLQQPSPAKRPRLDNPSFSQLSLPCHPLDDDSDGKPEGGR